MLTHAAVVAPNSHTLIVCASPHRTKYLGFIAVHRIALSGQPQYTPRGIVKSNPAGIASHQHDAKAQLAANHDVVLDFVAKANVVGAVTQPLGPVITLRIPLRPRFGEPRDSKLPVLRDTNAKLVGASQRELALHPSLLGARLKQAGRQIPIFGNAFP